MNSPPPEGAPRRQCDLLIRNAMVFTLDADQRVVSPGAIAIAGNLIVDVGDDAEMGRLYQAHRILDAGGGIAHPGFVEAHTHISNHLAREAFPDAADSAGYFLSYISMFNELSSEDEYSSALLASAEMLRSGITTFADSGTVIDTDAAAAAIEKAGIRGLLADPFVWDIDDFEWTTGIARVRCDLESAIERLGSQLWRNDAPGLVRGHIALWGMATASDVLELAAKTCADDHGVTLTQHQSFEPRDAERDDARLGCHPLVHLADIGFLGENVALSHMNYLRSDEIDALAGSGTSVVWNPGNFLFYSLAARTSSPIPDLISRDVNVALGTDTAKAWGYGEQALLGYLVVRGDGKFVSAERLLHMSTVGGAQAIGMTNEIGSIEPDKQADIVLRHAQLPELYPGIHPVRNAMLGLRSKGVDTVIVNGDIVLEGGHLTRFDEEEAFRVSRERARALMHRVGLGSPGI